MSFGEEVEEIEAHQGVTSRFSVRLRGDADLLIGERGANLAALEHILKKIIQKKSGEGFKFTPTPENKVDDDAHEQEEYSENKYQAWRFTLDINDYRMKRMEDLKQDVKAAAKEVRLYKKNVPLRSMSSFERRIVHLLLAEYPDITTESIGEEPDRRVVIKPYP